MILKQESIQFDMVFLASRGLTRICIYSVLPQCTCKFPPQFYTEEVPSPPELANFKDLNGIISYHDEILSWIGGAKVEVNEAAFLT